MYKPSDSYSKEFVTSSPTTGAATNADSLPVATADFDGSGTGSMALTVTNLDAGRYKVTGTVPAGRIKGDVLNVSVAATVGGVAGKAVVDTQGIDSKRVGDLNDSAYAGADTAGTTTLLGRLSSGRATNLDNLTNLDVPVSGRMATFSYTAPPTAAAIATAVLTDTADNTTAGSPGKILAQLLGAFTGTTSVFTAAALGNAPGGTGGGGDPWATAQPGGYAGGTFGNLVATTLGRVSGMLAADGLGGYQFTAKALANGPTGAGGAGAIVVNQDTGGADNLTYRSFGGTGIGGAVVRAYLASEWASDPLTAAVRGETTTVATGRWAGVMLLDAGSYTFAFQRAGASGVDTKTQAVS